MDQPGAGSGNIPVNSSQIPQDRRQSEPGGTMVGPTVDSVDVASEQSFPASDAPAWTISTIGPPSRAPVRE